MDHGDDRQWRSEIEDAIAALVTAARASRGAAEDLDQLPRRLGGDQPDTDLNHHG